MEVKQLDQIFEKYDILLHDSSSPHDEVFCRTIDRLGYDEASKFIRLYSSSEHGLKFVLFEVNGVGYVRVQKNIQLDKAHSDIEDRFGGELFHAKMFVKMHTKGGGNVRALKSPGKTVFHFYGASETLGSFDKDLLRKTLEDNLDKRLGYEIG